MSDTVHDVAGVDELKEGEMRAVKAGETEVLLVCTDGTFHALGAHCTHYHAPLADGVLHEGRIVCPWHHACFNASSGDLIEPPALNALPSFDVRVADGRVLVTLPEDPPDHRVPEMAPPNEAADNRTFAIIGGGAAGYAAAQTLREDGYRGRILVITAEDRMPYDRPNLSKDYLAGTAQPEWMPLRPDEFYAEHGIEVLSGRRITSLDAAEREVTFDDGATATFDAVLIATGGVARRPDIPGIDRSGVMTLRGFDDADALIEAAKNARSVVIVGGSFIGMEAAASLASRGCSVTVVAPERIPFLNTLGPEIGAMLKALHEKNGVTFRLERSVKSFEGGERITSVTLDDGSTVSADLVLVGAGVRPATDFVKGLELNKDGGIVVDERLRAADGVWAAGDVASFVDPRSGERTRIEHWRTALQQGRVAAHNMAGRDVDYDAVPFFWTNQYGEGVSYVGHAKRWDEIVVDGDIANRDFLAYFVDTGRIAAVAASGRDKQLDAISELMRTGRMPDADALRDGSFDWVAMLSS